MGAVALLLGGCTTARHAMVTAMARQIEWEHLTAADLPEQQVTIWLPPEYSLQPDKHFPVVYMWDGQNLFDPKRTHYGKAWMVQDVLGSMVAEGSAEPHIVVGVHSPPGSDRYRVYLPQNVAERIAGPVRAEMDRQASGAFAADRQLAWVTDALKPRIDREFRTQSAASKTTVVGASMGALMACYAAIERPDVFGRAGCVSVPFAPVDNALAASQRQEIERAWAGYLADRLGPPRGRRVWMDHGTAGLDGSFASWQVAVARDFAAAGWHEGADYEARAFEGAEHDENFWRARLPQILRWLWRDE